MIVAIVKVDIVEMVTPVACALREGDQPAVTIEFGVPPVGQFAGEAGAIERGRGVKRLIGNHRPAPAAARDSAKAAAQPLDIADRDLGGVERAENPAVRIVAIELGVDRIDDAAPAARDPQFVGHCGEFTGGGDRHRMVDLDPGLGIVSDAGVDDEFERRGTPQAIGQFDPRHARQVDWHIIFERGSAKAALGRKLDRKLELAPDAEQRMRGFGVEGHTEPARQGGATCTPAFRNVANVAFC